MKSKILLCLAIAFVGCKSDYDSSSLLEKYNSSNKSSYLKHYWEYKGYYKDSGVGLTFPRNLNLGNRELSSGQILEFGNTYLTTYSLDNGELIKQDEDYWYDANQIINILNKRYLVDKKNVQMNYQFSFPFIRHETNDTILLLDQGIKYYLLRKDNL